MPNVGFTFTAPLWCPWVYLVGWQCSYGQVGSFGRAARHRDGLLERGKQAPLLWRHLSQDAGTPDAGTGGVLAFQADPPTVYVAKVKNLLVGLPPTDAEVMAVTADPTQLKPLVQGWMQLPQYTQKMERFFELAFQQTQVTVADYADQAYPRQIAINTTLTPLLLQNLQESFARTMLELISEGQPLTVAMTTPKFMMTTALKELGTPFWSRLERSTTAPPSPIASRRTTRACRSPSRPRAQGPIPIAQTLDPTNANYMHWYDPDAATEDSTVAGCAMDPIVYPANGFTLHWLLYGTLDNRTLADGTKCPQAGGTAAAPQLTTADFRHETGRWCPHPPAPPPGRPPRCFTICRRCARRPIWRSPFRGSGSSARRPSSPTGRPTSATRCA